MPPRRTNSPLPQPPVLTGDQIRRRIERLRKCISDLEAFDPQQVQKRYNISEVVTLEASIQDALGAAFGHGTPRFNLYKGAADLDQGPHIARIAPAFGRGPTPDYDAEEAHEARKYLAEGKRRSISLLEQAIRTLEDDLADLEPSAPVVTSSNATVSNPLNRKVFVVHGHDEGVREAVARFLQQAGFDPIILNEQANRGRTVIEKVEDHGDVGFVVVLLTPDDDGCAKGEAPQPRARQNVLLELGYFVGRLGRDHVCTLQRGELEIPSDWRGVVDERFDSAGGWKQKLARELEAAGYEIDWNKVMRS